MSPSPPDWIPLRSDALGAEIDPQGAQLSVLRDLHQRDLLWNGDAAVWKGRAPVLFPVVGALNGGRYRWQGASHALGRHGFARDRRFNIARHDAHEALLRLTDDAESRKVYPFAYELDVLFRVEGTRLTTVASVRNTGNGPLPASLGFHPAFRWPLSTAAARDAYFLEFEKDEPAPIRRLDAQGLLTNEQHATPVRGRRLQLDDALFIDDVIVFDELKSRRVTYGAANGPRIEVSFPDATYLGLWTKPGAGFICIEPWRGVADPQGFNGEFSQKPGVFVVPPGASEALTMHFDCLPG
ncbi:MAG: aldose 1-epimerase family protein [Pseudomonadota bacterium]